MLTICHEPYEDLKTLLTDLEDSLRMRELGEWGISARSLLELGPLKQLGRLNGELGIAMSVGEYDRILSLEKEFLHPTAPVRSLYTGFHIGEGKIRVGELLATSKPALLTYTSNRRALGISRGLGSIPALTELALRHNVISADLAAMQLSEVSNFIASRLYMLETLPDEFLYSYEDGVVGLVVNRVLEAKDARIMVNLMLERMHKLSEGTFVVIDGKNLPYVALGTAGVLLSMLSIPQSQWPEHWYEELPGLINAISPSMSLNSGFGNGSAGLIYSVTRAYKLLDTVSIKAITQLRPMVREIMLTRIFQARHPSGCIGHHVMSEGLMAVSDDYWTGSAGVLVALKNYMDVTSDYFSAN